MKGNNKINWGAVIANFLLIVTVILAIIPLFWMLTSSLKTDGEFTINKFGLPVKPTLENYVHAWGKGNFQVFFKNSVFVSAVSLVLMIGLASLVAFALTRYKRVKFGNKVLLYFIIGQMISAQVILISIYLTLVQLKLIDSLWGLSLVYVASGLPFTVFLLHGFFRTIYFELYEAAFIDGYGDFRIFLTIALPLVKPGIATAFIIQFLYVWNEFALALITIRSASLTTLPVGIFKTIFDLYNTSYVMACAGLVITGLPTLLIYAVFQKQIISGMATGALKG